MPTVINSINSLSPSVRSKVLSVLRIKGNRGKPFVRYSFRELETFASILEDSHTLTPEGFERFIMQFNDLELDILESIIRGEDVSKLVQKEADRTRQMVRRIVGRLQREEQEQG